MACPVPFPKKMKDGSVRFLPCGHCLQCRIDKRNEWTWRIQSEIRKSDALFVTLTIDDEHLRYPPTLMKKSVQGFIKRLRNYTPSKLRYFFVGEYGETGERPHYHGIILGLSSGKPLTTDFGDTDLIRKAWPFGYVNVKPASKGAIRYCLKYMDKMQDKSYWIDSNRIPPFRLMSKGFGRDFITENADYLRELDGFFYYEGKRRPLPRYYKEKLFSKDELENMPKHESVAKRGKIREYMARYDVSAVQARYELGKQQLLNLQGKSNCKDKKI